MDIQHCQKNWLKFFSFFILCKTGQRSLQPLERMSFYRSAFAKLSEMIPALEAKIFCEGRSLSEMNSGIKGNDSLISSIIIL
jgi:hypothetical protein